MNRLHTISLSAAALALTLASCSTKQYQVASVERTRILIDSRYDNSTDPEVVRTNNALLERKKLVDAEMNPVQGHAAENLWVKRPESPLSNLHMLNTKVRESLMSFLLMVNRESQLCFCFFSIELPLRKELMTS